MTECWCNDYANRLNTNRVHPFCPTHRPQPPTPQPSSGTLTMPTTNTAPSVVFIPSGVFAPSPDLKANCECGHPAGQHWIGGPAGNRVGCEARGCGCGVRAAGT